MAVQNIPSMVNDFNAYSDGSKLIGVTAEVEVPNLEAMTSTVSGTGILGEFEEPAIGHFGSIELNVPFRTVNEDFYKCVKVTEALDLTLRGAVQYTDPATQAVTYKGMRIVTRGKVKTVTLGTVRQRGQMDASITVEVTYMLIEFDGKARLEIDKLNGVYKQNGTDLLAEVKQLT